MLVCSWTYAANCVLNRALKHVHHAIVMHWHGVIGIVLALGAVFIEAAVSPGPIRLFNQNA